MLFASANILFIMDGDKSICHQYIPKNYAEGNITVDLVAAEDYVEVGYMD